MCSTWRAALRRTLHRQPRRQPGRDGRFRLVDGRSIGQPQVDPVDATEPVERLLRAGDVHHHEMAVEDARRSFVLQQPPHGQRDRAVADVDRDRRSDVSCRGFRELRRQNHRPGSTRSSRNSCGRGSSDGAGRLEEPIVAKRPIAQDVDAEHPQPLRRTAALPQHDVALDDRRHLAVVAQPAELEETPLVEARGRCRRFRATAARHGVQRRLESGAASWRWSAEWRR